MDLSGLQPAQRADYIRAFLLQRYGGLWVDADCLVMKSLQPVLDLLAHSDFVGHRERVRSRSPTVSSPRGREVGSRRRSTAGCAKRFVPVGRWVGPSLGSTPLNLVLAKEPGWHELPCECVQPICWSRPEAFFSHRTPREHEQVFDLRAICYMLSNAAISTYSAANGGPDLLDERTFFSFLLKRALRHAANDPTSRYEEVFATHAELYRSYRDESVSGPGSSLAATQELRERLPLLLENLAVRTLLDAPCGDLNWMQHVQLALAEYIGVDILGENIANNEWQHGSPHRRFLRADVIHDPLPRADAIFCRDLLPHLSFAEIALALANFQRSGATYLLTTTFTEPRPNRETSGGNWRTLNLMLPPFCFPAPLGVVNEKCAEGGGAFRDKSIGVWRLRDLPTVLGG